METCGDVTGTSKVTELSHVTEILELNSRKILKSMTFTLDFSNFWTTYIKVYTYLIHIIAVEHPIYIKSIPNHMIPFTIFGVYY